MNTETEHPGNAVHSPAMLRAVLIAAIIGDFLSPFLMASLAISTPEIGKDLGLEIVNLGWILSSFLLASSALMLTAGRLGDCIGYKRIFAAGLVFSLAGCIIASFASTFPVLIIALVIIGVCSGFMWATTIPLRLSAFPPGMRGKLMGHNSAAVYSGVAAGPVIGGVLIHYFGWHSIFLAVIPIVLFNLLLTWVYVWKLPDNVHHSLAGFDIGGSVLFAIAMITLIYGFSVIPGITGFVCIGSSLVLFSVFILYEKRMASPIFDVNLLFGNRKFMLAGTAAMLGYSITAGMMYVMPLFIQSIMGYSPLVTGMVYVGAALCQVIFSMIAGSLSDRVTSGHISAAGLTLAAIALVLLLGIDPTTSLVIIAVLMMVLYTGLAFFGTPNTYAIMGSVPMEKQGMAAGTIATLRRFGNQLSIAIPMMIFSIILGNVVLADVNPQEFMLSFRIIVGIFIVLTVTGIVCSILQEKARGRET
ncbi:MFS transporter [uncultured Methanoregula sp.]|uniref:MFS transporter n=1 Tax=uncultured Methanoregula sp. TaxID=1005933 RepID=UPI002AAB7E84|nr:MFS transporter [uncultured Methanoregula sp.]